MISRAVKISILALFLIPFSASAEILYLNDDNTGETTQFNNASLTTDQTYNRFTSSYDIATGTAMVLEFDVKVTNTTCASAPFGQFPQVRITDLSNNAVIPTLNEHWDSLNNDIWYHISYATSTIKVINAGQDYLLKISENCNAIKWQLRLNSDSSAFYGAFYTDTYSESPLDVTRIITTVPEHASTTATTTSKSVGFTANIASGDYVSDGYFNFYIRRDGISQFAGPAMAGENGNIITKNPDAVSGFNTFSTTTALSVIGKHTLHVEYRKPKTFIGIPFGYEIITATTTSFTVGQLNPFEQFQEDTASDLSDLIASSTASVADSCTPLSGSFGVGACLYALIVPTGSQMSDNIIVLRAIPPWGYVFRTYDILAGNATTSTSTMPTISYTTGTTSFIGATTFDFDPFGTLLDAGSIVNTPSDQEEQKTVWEIMEGVINLIVYLSLIFMIIRDLTGIAKPKLHHYDH